MDGKRYIHLASRDGRRFVKRASIKGQCARHKFYGDEKVENWLNDFESRHSIVYRSVLNIAWNARQMPLSNKENHHLREAVLLQRSRTPRNAHIHASSVDQARLDAYYEYLKASPTTSKRQAIIKAIERGKVTVKNSQFESLMYSLLMIPHVVPVISDLLLLILRNQTTIPFIMADAPCVFSNHYIRSIQHSGVLGFTSPGLMIVLPIDSRTQILLYDSSTYTVEYSTTECIDVFRVADISLLNALQIHSAEENVYFSDIHSEAYVRKLLSAHHSILQNHRGGFAIHSPGEFLINDAPKKGKLLHMFEPQLPITFDLSFIATTSLPQNKDPNRPRNPVLAQQVYHALGMLSEPSPMRMDEFERWMESSIHIPDDI